MNIPSISSIVTTPVIQENGKLHENWRQFLEHFTKTLQLHLDDHGHIMPAQPQSAITKLNTNQNKARLLYNTDTNTLHVNNEGTYKEIETKRDELTTAERTAIPSEKITGKWVWDTDESKLYTGLSGVWREVNIT